MTRRLHVVSRSRNTIILGLILSVALLLQCMTAPNAGDELTQRLVQQPNAAIASQVDPAAEPLADPVEAELRNDPLQFLRESLARYERTVRDYSCTFIKKERINGQLRPEEQMAARFREDPMSVYLKWERPGKSLAHQALYVRGQLRDEEGNELAYVNPAGPIALLAKRVKQEIHGASARQASRRFIDQFGFANSLRLILKYSDIARERDELDLRFVGEGEVNGRPTYVIERRLPYTGEGGEYPDALLVVHIDQELRLPTGCFSYASESRDEDALLGSYLWTDIELNIGLTDDDFTPAANDF
jgi:hypothetical protein